MRRRRVEEGEEKRPETVEAAYSPINEQVVLAAALVDKEACAKLLQKLRPEHFLVDAHRAAWTALAEMQRRKLEFDWATVQQLGGDRVSVKQLQELSDLRPDAPAPSNLDHHVQALYWDRQRAVAVQGPLSALLECLRKPSEAPEKVRAIARQLAQSFDGTGQGRQFRDAGEAVAEKMKEVALRSQGQACFPYGIDGLDRYEDGLRDDKGRELGGRFRMIPGAKPGTVTVVTALTGQGKSTFTCHIALGQRAMGKKVLYGAWELGTEDTLEMLACLELGWSRTDLAEGIGIGHDEKVELEDKMHDICRSIVFWDNPYLRTTGGKRSTDANMDLLHQRVADAACDVVIFDPWERVLVTNDPGDEQRALWRQHSIAEEMRVHVVLVAQQLLKENDKRPDKHPVQERIKGSSAWADVADTTLGVHRPASWKRIPDDRMEIDILKQRRGVAPQRVEFAWDPEFGSISGGRTVPYEHGGQDSSSGENEFMAAPKPSGEGRSRKGRR